jgi:hypothetical protein
MVKVKKLDPLKDGMTVIEHLMHPNYKRLFPQGEITILSVADDEHYDASDSGFGLERPIKEDIDLRNYIRNCVLFKMWHKENRSRWDKSDQSILGRCFVHEYIAMLYYESYSGMLRGSYDALHWALIGLRRHIEQSGWWQGKETRINFPLSVRAGMDREVVSAMVHSVFRDKRYRVNLMM